MNHRINPKEEEGIRKLNKLKEKCRFLFLNPEVWSLKLTKYTNPTTQ